MEFRRKWNSAFQTELYKLAENEADTITICGMGGKLIQSILENGSSKISENTQLILSPPVQKPRIQKVSFGVRI